MSISPAAASCKVILSVDDHPLIRGALREVLCTMAQPVELLEASDPLEGLAVLKQHPNGRVTLRARTSIELMVGSSKLKIEPGKITLEAGTIDIKSRGNVNVTADAQIKLNSP